MARDPLRRARDLWQALVAAIASPALSSTLTAWLVWLPGCIAFGCALLQLAGPNALGRSVAVVLAAAGLFAPALMPPQPVLRAGAALYLFWTCVKVVGLVRDPVPRSRHFRLLQGLVIYDLRRDRAWRDGFTPELRLATLAHAGVAGAIAALGLTWAMFDAARLAEPWRAVLRHVGGLTFVYFGLKAVLATFELVYRACGLKPPVLHDEPIGARSVGEFWGRRWNRIVGGWLFETFYRPLAARGRHWLGVCAAFAASAVLHLHFTWAGVGPAAAVVMAAFFVAQMPIVWLEERLGQARWRRALRHAWTLGWLFVTSPLFIEPLLRIFAGGFER